MKKLILLAMVACVAMMSQASAFSTLSGVKLTDLGTAFSFPQHRPVDPGLYHEALELTPDGSIDMSNWFMESLDFVVVDGWVENGIPIEVDNYAPVGSFVSSYQDMNAFASHADDYGIGGIGAAVAVPEPATIILIGLGTLGMGLTRKFRRK